MDFRFLVAGILAAAMGFISGSTVFADAPRRAIDPSLAQAARDRAAVAVAAAAPLPPTAELPPLPKLPPPPPDVNAVVKVPKVRVVVVRRTSTPARPVSSRRRASTPARPATSRGASRHEHQREHEHEGSDHERGDD